MPGARRGRTRSAAPAGVPDLRPLLHPGSIAVIGASRDAASIGREVLRNLIRFEFQGPVYPVNPKATSIQSLKCYPDVRAIPDPVDLAVIVVPASTVPRVVTACAGKGVKALVVITAGFRETGPRGAALEAKVQATIRRHGMRLVGPNCMGVVNTAAGVRMNATFAATPPLPGHIGFASQSGALGEAILDLARDQGLGLSTFVSMGNKTDVSANDLLAYWERDPATKLILLYLESFGNPRKFTQLATRLSKTKPILAVKSGRSQAGARAAALHTGSLAGSDLPVEALLEQCGVIRAYSMEEMFNLATAFVHQPLPRGRRLAILTNAGGPGIMAADAADGTRLELAEFTPATRRKLQRLLPPEAPVGNPVDLIASATADRYRAAITPLLADPNVDALIVIFVSPITIDAAAVARAIAESCAGSGKPVCSCFMGKGGHQEGIQVLRRHGIPTYEFPEWPVRALDALCRQAEWRRRREGTLREFPVDDDAVRRVLRAARRRGATRLVGRPVRELLTAYGLPVVPAQVIPSLERALDAANGLGYPVVLKLNAPTLLHRTDVGGVLTDLRTPEELIDAYRTLRRRGETRLEGRHEILMQPMVKGGKEVILGMTSDPSFGPLLMVGLGGIYTEVMQDVQFRIHPVTDRQAREMIERLRGYPLLAGVRGEAGVDCDLLAECLGRLSQLVSRHQEIAHLDCNPFILQPRTQDSGIVDAKLVLHPPGPRAGQSRRRNTRGD